MRAWFLNLGPSTTTDAQANRDISAVWETQPALLVGCEAIGKGNLPSAGRGRGTKIRDISKPGRANLFAYVDADLDPDWIKWTDCTTEFPRNERPGNHWPRSILSFPFLGQQIVVAHKPPLWKGAAPARSEHDKRLKRILSPEKNHDRSRMLLWDSNGMKGAYNLASAVGMRVVGDHIDNALVRRIEVTEVDYRKQINGHKFATDHPWGALFIRFKFKENSRNG